MAEVKRPLKVFLCHASADKPKVLVLYHYLCNCGVKPWLDSEDLIPGQTWQHEIPQAIASSDAIIICLTKNSVDKVGYFQKEIRYALDKALEMPPGHIFIIPARLEDCEIADDNLKQYHWVNLFEKDGSLKLMQSLKILADKLGRSNIEIPDGGEGPGLSGWWKVVFGVVVIAVILVAIIGLLGQPFKPVSTLTPTKNIPTATYTPLSPSENAGCSFSYINILGYCPAAYRSNSSSCNLYAT